MAKTLSNKKKIIVMSALVLLLAVTAVFNFVLADTSANVNANEPVTAANYFAAYRSERTTTRNEELTQLDGVIRQTSFTAVFTTPDIFPSGAIAVRIAAMITVPDTTNKYSLISSPPNNTRKAAASRNT